MARQEPRSREGGRDALQGAPPWAGAAGGRRVTARRAAARQGATASRSPKRSEGTGRGSRRSAPWCAQGGAQGGIADSPPARHGTNTSQSECERQGCQARDGAKRGGTGAWIAPEVFGERRGVQDARAPYRDVGRRFGPRTDGGAGSNRAGRPNAGFVRRRGMVLRSRSTKKETNRKGNRFDRADGLD